MGQSYDLILFNIKAWITYEENGGYVANDQIQVIIDNKTKPAYDSVTLREKCNNFRGNINSYEDGIVMFLNSGVLSSGNNDYLWSDSETSTRFTKANIKTINDSLNK